MLGSDKIYIIYDGSKFYLIFFQDIYKRFMLLFWKFCQNMYPA